MTGRSVPEWIGGTPDTKVPGDIRLRVFRDHGGICHISRRKITPSDKWDVDHVIPLWAGGENRERNLAPAITDEHKKKTRREAKERARGNAAAKRHLGIVTGKRALHGRDFPPAAPQRSATTPHNKQIGQFEEDAAP